MNDNHNNDEDYTQPSISQPESIQTRLENEQVQSYHPEDETFRASRKDENVRTPRQMFEHPHDESGGTIRGPWKRNKSLSEKRLHERSTVTQDIMSKPITNRTFDDILERIEKPSLENSPINLISIVLVVECN